MVMNIQSYYNAGYYTAELDEPEWHPNMNMWGQDWYPEIEKWCRITFGKSDLWGEEPVNGWKSMRNKFFFTEEKQLEWFILRWT
jgi:hypothetical protein